MINNKQLTSGNIFRSSHYPASPLLLTRPPVKYEYSKSKTIRGKSTAEIGLNVYFYVDMSFQCLIPVITIVFIPGFGCELHLQDSPESYQTMSKVLLMCSVNNWRKPFAPNIVISISSFLSLAIAIALCWNRCHSFPGKDLRRSRSTITQRNDGISNCNGIIISCSIRRRHPLFIYFHFCSAPL